MAAKKELSVDDKVNAVIQKINSHLKYRAIAAADQVPNAFYLRRPSGIMQLDIDTGGGLPAGGSCVLSGPDGAGKTFLLSKYMVRHQRLYGANSRIAIATVESPPDHAHLRFKHGLKIALPDEWIQNRIEYNKARGLPAPTKAEIKDWKTTVGRIDVITGKTQEDTLQAVLDLINTKAYGIIGVDSISAMIPSADAGKDLDENSKRAASASAMTEFYKRYHPTTLGIDGELNETTLILISQVRANAKKAEAQAHIQKYMRDWAPTGAYATRHGKLIDITIWPGEKLKKGSGDDRVQTGKTLCWELTKGKAGCHDGIRGEVDFHFDSFTDDPLSVFLAGIQYGVFDELDSKSVRVLRAGTGEVMKDSITREELLDRLENDVDFDTVIRIEILAAAKIECRYR